MPFPKYFNVTKRYDENFYQTVLQAVALNPGIILSEVTTFVKTKIGHANRGVIYNALEALLHLGKLRAEFVLQKKGRPKKAYFVDKPDMPWSDVLLKSRRPKVTTRELDDEADAQALSILNSDDNSQ